MSSDKDFVFVATAGQSGATFLGRNLGEVIYECRSAHEPDRIRRRKRKLTRTTRTFGYWNALRWRGLPPKLIRRLLTGRITAAEAGARLIRSRARFHRLVEDRLVVESHGCWWALGDALRAAWPQAKFISVIRDPREWVGAVGDANPLFGLKPADLGEAPPGPGALALKLWRWRAIVGRMTDFADRTETAEIWRYEDIFARDPASFETLVRFAARHGDRNYPVASLIGRTDAFFTLAEEKAPDWRKWSAEDARLADEICGELMARWGYGEEPEWRALLAG